MKKAVLFAVAIAAVTLGAVEVVPQVSDKGVMTLSCSGRTIIQSSGIVMNNANGEVVSDVAKAQMKTFRNRNRIRYSDR